MGYKYIPAARESKAIRAASWGEQQQSKIIKMESLTEMQDLEIDVERQFKHVVGIVEDRMRIDGEREMKISRLCPVDLQILQIILTHGVTAGREVYKSKYTKKNKRP